MSPGVKNCGPDFCRGFLIEEFPKRGSSRDLEQTYQSSFTKGSSRFSARSSKTRKQQGLFWFQSTIVFLIDCIDFNEKQGWLGWYIILIKNFLKSFWNFFSPSWWRHSAASALQRRVSVSVALLLLDDVRIVLFVHVALEWSLLLDVLE